MSLLRKRALLPILAVLVAGCSQQPSATTTTTTSASTTPTAIANLQPFTDTSGTLATYTTAGVIDLSQAFFQPLGTNGRSCATCHQAGQAMSLQASTVAALFASTNGTDPLFDPIDGANCPTVATGDLNGHSLIVNYGLVRIAMTLPATAQFTITTLNDPFGCATTLSTTGQQIVSVYRRPLPTSGLPYLSSVMWDTRFTTASLSTAATFDANLTSDLTVQLLSAVTTHQQATTNPSSAQINSMLALEQGLYTAQSSDALAGSLSANGATGGPSNFAAVNFYPGINDAFGGDPTGAAFNQNAFTLYNAWNTSNNAQQASISRGQKIFNTAGMNLTTVNGINTNNAALGNPAHLKATCSTCHDTPNVGNHSLPLPLDTGTMHVASAETDPNTIAGLAQLTQPTLPTYQITGCKDTNNRPVTYTTTDPGKALLTGLCSDVNLLKVPILRGLAARAPYFHNGSAANLTQLVNFYNARFQMNLSVAQMTDLINFLNAL